MALQLRGSETAGWVSTLAKHQIRLRRLEKKSGAPPRLSDSVWGWGPRPQSDHAGVGVGGKGRGRCGTRTPDASPHSAGLPASQPGASKLPTREPGKNRTARIPRPQPALPSRARQTGLQLTCASTPPPKVWILGWFPIQLDPRPHDGAFWKKKKILPAANHVLQPVYTEVPQIPAARQTLYSSALSCLRVLRPSGLRTRILIRCVWRRGRRRSRSVGLRGP